MTSLRKSDFDYELPRSMIAQRPLCRREDSRLLVYQRGGDEVAHRRFGDIGDYLEGPALLVLNDTRVIPARLIGNKRGTGGRVELLLVSEEGPGRWICLLKPAARVRGGTVLGFAGSSLSARVERRVGDGSFVLAFDGVEDFASELDRIGHAPLPPYIKRPLHASPFDAAQDTRVTRHEDKERYQTVYARRPGAVAAPTAGLHFSTELLRALERGGVEIATVTLHVGPGTFLPVKEEYLSGHRIHAEYFEISGDAAGRINRARAEGRRMVVVGTTTARALETVAAPDGRIEERSGQTDLFIYPPYRFKIVENLLTNFHLPCSTLLMLVAALAGREKILELYGIARAQGYRFYSYGDAMLIISM